MYPYLREEAQTSSAPLSSLVLFVVLYQHSLYCITQYPLYLVLHCTLVDKTTICKIFRVKEGGCVCLMCSLPSQ